MSNLYSNHEKFALLEVEIEPEEVGSKRKLATVNTSYMNMKTHTTDRLSSSVIVNFSGSPATVDNRTNKELMVDVVKLVAAEKNDLVIALRDKGKIEEAKEVSLSNIEYLTVNAVQLDSEELHEESVYQTGFTDKIEADEDYKKSRKDMRENQHIQRTQQKE
jgi:Ca-activated chloride channel family protein